MKNLLTGAPMPTEASTLSEQVVRRLFGVLLSALRQFSLSRARTTVAKAGITGLNAPMQYWDPFISGVDAAFDRLEPEARLSAVLVLANEFAESEEVRSLFAQHGYEYVGGTFVPIALLDQREALYLPLSSASELAKAMKRLTEGDDTGAITAACGAVDTLMQDFYGSHQLGDPGKVAFAAKVNTVASRLNIFDEMKSELTALGMDVRMLIAWLPTCRKRQITLPRCFRRSGVRWVMFTDRSPRCGEQLTTRLNGRRPSAVCSKGNEQNSPISA